MRTPRGGQYKLTLPDGTDAWLNAASSITFPTVFSGKERKVRITGEVYFEVAKNAKQPFIVEAKSEIINVLGTSFNVSAYEEESIKTSLLEGAVKIADKVLKPGEAFINGKVVKTNIEQDIAWKNGNFYFDDAELKDILRQFTRWYDIEVIYQGPLKNRKFFGVVKEEQ